MTRRTLDPRRLRAQLAGARQVAGTVARNPAMVRDVVAGLLGRQPAAPTQALDAGEAPAWIAAFAHRVAAARTVAASPDRVVDVLSDLGSIADWLTLHTGWRDEAPGAAEVGVSFVQRAEIMAIPADVRWTVERVAADGLDLRGKGPMGLVLALALQVRPSGGGSHVTLHAGLDGQPVKGPLGTSIVRSLGGELDASLGRLESRVAGAPSGRPVLHRATGRTIPASTPVLVGVGQHVNRRPDPSADPAALSVTALRRAEQDAGVPGLLASADTILAVPSASWTYADAAALVGERVGATPTRTVASSPYGGDGAQLLVNEAARSIAEGEAHVALVVGAEAGATQSSLQRSGQSPKWPVQAAGVAPSDVVGVDKSPHNEIETGVGLSAPIYVYALLENAVRRKRGRGVEEHRQAVAGLWSRFSAVAARNPYAWQPTELTAEAIAEPSAENRMVSEPYTKLMCANLTVDLGTGLILMSAAAAEAAGVPQEKWVFVHAGAWASDEWFVSERADLAASPAIRAAGEAALGHAGITIDDVRHVDLYACFPSAVQIGADALGLPDDDPERPLTVTGGLTFGGGPGNNYGSHAVANLVPLLRAEPGTYGLSTSLGWYATKHALGVYSATPPQRLFEHLHPTVDLPPSRRALGSYAGRAVVETWTIPWLREGEPEAVVVSLLTPEGDRMLLRREDRRTLGLFMTEDPSGWQVEVADDGSFTVVDEDVHELPAPPPAPVLVEQRGAVTVITLDRPEARNAIDARTARLLERAIDRFESDPAARVAVLTGAGGTFSAGMDLKAANRGELPYGEHRGPLGLTERPPGKPLVAAVEGSALAGGCELALAADLIVAAEDAELGLPEPRRGLVAAAGGVLRVSERLPRNVAMELVLTGDPLPARRLHELGLVNVLAPAGKVLDAAIELAERIADNAPLSIAVGKRIVEEAPHWSAEDAFLRQSELAAPVISSQDAAEGVAAFAERRTPRWTGR
jgi:acetyl-CoA C-acetyltransferase